MHKKASISLTRSERSMGITLEVFFIHVYTHSFFKQAAYVIICGISEFWRVCGTR